jgi:type I restriction enzyme S subunit
MTIPQGYKQTELGIIPEDWEVKTIASLGNIVGGGTPSTIIPAYWDGGIQWFTPAEIGASKYISKSERSISKLGLQSSAARILPKDAILLTTRASIGLSAILLNEATTNQGFQSIIINTNHCNEYAYYALKTKVSEMLTLASGSTFAEISKAKLASIKLPIPPIAEQRAIAEALRDIDELIVALDKKIEKKRLIKQGAMQELLTGKKRLPGFSDEWIKCELLTVCNVLDNKRVPLNDEQRTSGIYPYCGANGIVDYIDRYIFDEDLILIAEDGGNFDQYETRPIAYWMSGKYWVNNHAHVLKAKNEYNQKYIFYQLEHKDITDYIVGGTRTKLTRAQLDKIEISMPSTYAEQQAIATILNDMDKEIANLEVKRDKYRLIKSGMMQKLLTGQIRLKIE